MGGACFLGWCSSVQFSHSVVSDPMDCSTPGFLDIWFQVKGLFFSYSASRFA